MTTHVISPATERYLSERQAVIIDGKRCRASGAAATGCIDPATGEQIGEADLATIEDVDRAAHAARRSFDDGRWRDKTPAARQRILLRVAELIERDALILAELETVNGGKLLASALHGEVPHAAETFRYYAGWTTKLGGQVFEPSVPGRRYHAYVRRDPVGVAALITPWNGALVSASWKLAPALAAGCSCILKPAELTPLSSLYLGLLLEEAGLPDGVVNILPGRGRDVGAALVRHPLVSKVSFTGSTQVGKQLVNDSSADLTRLSLELGGKSPVLIFSDADLNGAIETSADGIFANAGQVCVAGSRIYAERSIFDKVVEAVAEKARNLRLGPGLESRSTLGPLISAAHRARVQEMVDQAVVGGARLVTGGEVVGNKGFFYAPTVLTGAAQESALVQEEVFGPVVSIAPFDTEAEALSLANDCRYGLAAGIWTRDLSRAHRLAAQVEAGITWINDYGIPELAMPIGGVKQSGFGREHGREGLDAFTETRSVMMRI